MPEPATPNNDTAHAHALALAALGLKVLPIRPGTKVPPLASWQHAATNDPTKINNWYNGLYTKCGTAIALGPQPNGTNLFALDLDNHSTDGDGRDELHHLETIHGKLPDTWRSITGSDGTHIILTAPTGMTVRNQQATGNRVAPNIDIRGDGGQIVVAPTIHPTTLTQYVWEHGYAPWEIDVAEAPAWLLELVCEPEVKQTVETFNVPTGHESRLSSDDITVFDRQRQEWNWETELQNRGWTHSHTHQHDSYWVRPGKDRREGHSAVLHQPDGPLVIFTTEIDPTWTQAGTRTRDGSGWTFGPFGFYAATQHHGDRSAAARALYERYDVPMAQVDLGDLIAAQTSTQDAETPPDQYDAELLDMVLDWPTFWSVDHKAEEWLWQPVIAAKRSTAIFAAGGIGKSLIVLRMALDMIANGTKVLYLDYEMTPDDLADRLDDMGHHDDSDLRNLHYALLPAIPAFDTPEGGKAVRRLAQLVNADIVIIDTFARAVEGDENDADTVRQFYRMTGLHLKADGRAFIRIDHAGKDVGKGQRGSSAKNDDVDVVWHLRRTETGYQLLAKKRRMGWVPEKVNLTRHDGPFELEATDRNAYPAGTSEVAQRLDDIGVDEDASQRTASKAYREAGHRASSELIRAAQRYRSERSGSYHFVGDLVATESAKSAPEPFRRAPDEDDSGALSGALEAKHTKDQVDDLRRGVRRAAARSADTDSARCASLKEAHGDSVTPEPVDNSELDDFPY